MKVTLFSSAHGWLRGISIGLCLSHGLVAQAASPPDAGTLMRDTERQVIPPAQPKPAPQVVPEVPAMTDLGQRVLVKGFRFSGVTLFTDADLQQLIATYVGRELSFRDLQKVADIVATHYRQYGRFARAYLPQQSLAQGIVTIAVIEGHLGEVRIDDGGKPLRIRRDVAQRYLGENLQKGEPLRLGEVERGVRLLNDLPGLTAAAMLKPGAAQGEIDVVAKLEDKPLVAGSAQLDNFGSRSTGYTRFTGAVFINNPSGIGDQIGLIGNHSTGVDYGRAAYTVPVGHDGLQVGANASRLAYRLGKQFSSLNAFGHASTWGLTSL